MDILNSYSYFKVNPQMKVWNIIKYILNPIDIISILLAFQCSYILHNYETGGLFFTDYNLLGLFIWIFPFWITILTLVKLTGIPTKRHKVLFFLYLQSSISIFFLLTLCNYFFRLDTIPRMFLAELSFFSFLFLFFGRLAVFNVLKMFGKKGYKNTNIIIIADATSAMFMENLLAKIHLGYKVIVIFTESELIKSKFENSSIILSENFLGILKDLIKVDFVDEVLYLKESNDSSTIREILRTCEDLGITLRIKAKESKVNLSSAVKTDIADGKFLTFENIPNNSYAMAIKRTIDINIALLAIVVLFPILVLVSILIKATSRGPLVYNFSKTGFRGQEITVYRFRTTYMSDNYESELQNGSIEPEIKDSRLTPVGRFLLMSGLDHLPQLFNALKGEIPIIVQKHPLQGDPVA
jgi:hypothetical protein